MNTTLSDCHCRRCGHDWRALYGFQSMKLLFDSCHMCAEKALKGRWGRYGLLSTLRKAQREGAKQQ